MLLILSLRLLSCQEKQHSNPVFREMGKKNRLSTTFLSQLQLHLVHAIESLPADGSGCHNPKMAEYFPHLSLDESGVFANLIGAGRLQLFN